MLICHVWHYIITPAICHLPLAICHLPFAICHLPFANCHLPIAILIRPVLRTGVDFAWWYHTGINRPCV